MEDSQGAALDAAPTPCFSYCLCEVCSGPVLLPQMTLVWVCSCSRGVHCPRPAPAGVTVSVLLFWSSLPQTCSHRCSFNNVFPN
ncbi:hypothetical protein LEMLEM_LOCUS22642, partial [Lemmus lemmus]